MPILREELSPKGNIIRKLGYLCVGLAIGFTMLGMFQRARQAEIAKLRAAQEAALRQPIEPALPLPPQSSPAASEQASIPTPTEPQAAPTQAPAVPVAPSR
jgi:hypothetical protein